MDLVKKEPDAAARPVRGADESSPMLTEAFWEDVFAREDPWNYETSAYERWKFAQTLSLLPAGPFDRALELGCAEGHLTSLLAPRVRHLTAIDISPTAIQRARARCRDLLNVDFEVLNLVQDRLPANLDLILCSEVLYYLPRGLLDGVAATLARSLRPGGHLLLAHGNSITDDRSRTGFDWGHPFGAKTIGEVFRSLDHLVLAAELRTPLYTVHLLRRVSGPAEKDVRPQILEAPLPFDLALSADIERRIVWNGPVTTRDEAREREVATQVPILMYHSIADDGPPELKQFRVSPRTFREQLQYLRRHGFYSITLEEWCSCIAAKKPLRGRPVILTFDDGYKDFLENAWPALNRADFSATVFVVTDKVGGVADWDTIVSKPLPLMTWEDLGSLASNGVAIASHSASHKDFLKLSATDIQSEGERARRTLKEKLGGEVKAIAYPWGRTNASVCSTIAACGYTIGLTTLGGPSTTADDPLSLPRIEIMHDDDINEFARKLTPGTKPSANDPGNRRDLRVEPAGLRSDELRAARTHSGMLHPDYVKSLGRRLDALVGELVILQMQLLEAAGSEPSLQKRLVALFAQPVTGKVRRNLRSGDEISPGVAVSFNSTAQVTLSVEPKVDHSLSPDTFINALTLNLVGSSERFLMRIALEWHDLALAERFQLSLYARPSRRVACDLALRLPRKAAEPRQVNLVSFEIDDKDGNAVLSGDVTMPDFMDLDTSRSPEMLLCFNAAMDLAIVIHYINVYFA
jgi:peptidoglycan/xylan/chitin deacetylase (PgdA/CDA1 family)